jgi:hypothetical protein
MVFSELNDDIKWNDLDNSNNVKMNKLKSEWSENLNNEYEWYKMLKNSKLCKTIEFTRSYEKVRIYEL